MGKSWTYQACDIRPTVDGVEGTPIQGMKPARSRNNSKDGQGRHYLDSSLTRRMFCLCDDVSWLGDRSLRTGVGTQPRNQQTVPHDALNRLSPTIHQTEWHPTHERGPITGLFPPISTDYPKQSIAPGTKQHWSWVERCQNSNSHANSAIVTDTVTNTAGRTTSSNSHQTQYSVSQTQGND
jgi:hypothetical protein